MLCRDPVLLEAMSRLIIEDEGEGVILRKPGSKYDSGRSPSLLKLKVCKRSAGEFAMGGSNVI